MANKVQTVNLDNYKKNSKGIYYAELYHPYYRGRNSLFNDFSSKILSLKNGLKEGIDYFIRLLIEKEIYDNEYTIVTVPPSDPRKHQKHGTNLLINTLFKTHNIKQIVNGSNCLIRTSKVEKSVGGSRSIEKHLESIKISSVNLIKGKTCLLIDDVTTTGCSIVACKQILSEGKCKAIVSMALGQTSQHDLF